MKFYLLLLGCLSLIFNLYAEEKPQTVDANITDVTLYFTEAQIFKSAKVSLSKGINTLHLNAISPFIIKESLKINTDKLVAIHGISIETDYLTNEQNKELKSLEDDKQNILYKTIEDSIKICKAFESILTQQKAFIKNNRLSPQNNEFSKYMKLENKIISNTHNLNELKKRLQKLKAKKEQSNIQMNKSTKVTSSGLSFNKIQIVLQSKKEQTIDLSVDYLVKGVSWVPFYDILFST